MKSNSNGAVRLLAPSEAPRAAGVLARALVDDPGFLYALPGQRRLEGLKWMFEHFLRAVWLRGGRVDALGDGPHAVAVWLDVKGSYGEPFLPMIRSGLGAMPLKVGLAAAWRLAAFSRAMIGLHRKYAPASHHYLQVMGVEPAEQGAGLGSRLLEAGLALAKHQPVYLETNVHRNVGLYQRHGFRVVETGEPLPGVPVWSMVRPAIEVIGVPVAPQPQGVRPQTL